MVVLSNLPVPETGVRHSQKDTTALLESTNLGKGTLYIAESRLTWTRPDGQGFSLEYPAISMHAVSRDHRVFQGDCLYLVVEANLGAGGRGNAVSSSEFDSVAHMLGSTTMTQDAPSTSSHAASTQPDVDPASGDAANGDGAGSSSESGSDVAMDESPITEIRFIPDDSASLDVMFQTMSDCQALHPDPEDADSDSDVEFEDGGAGMGEFFNTEGGVSQLTAEGRAQMDRLNAMLSGNAGDQNSSDQADDVDMEQGGPGGS